MLAKGLGSTAAPGLCPQAMGQGHNSTWGTRQAMVEGKSFPSALLFPIKAIEEAAARKEIDACSFLALGFKWPCGWAVAFLST